MDDLNEWSKANFDEVIDLFSKSIDRNRKLFENSGDLGESNGSGVVSSVKRDKVIQGDDLVNLKILLGNIDNVDDFLKSI